jgi:hypothetical protein
MRILLATDDTRYASEMLAAAARVGVSATVVSTDQDLEAAAGRLASNVVVLDALNAVTRTTRRASSFAALHPRVAVGLVADHASARSIGNLLVFDRWRSTERLLRDLAALYLGLRRSSAGK